MSKGKYLFRETDLKRFVADVTKAGLPVKSVRLNKQGEL